MNSFGFLKGLQKIQIQFWVLHVGFCIVDNTELRRARAAGDPPSFGVLKGL